MTKKVIVIGAGPAGYVAAIKAAQSGFDTTCVEKEYLGGTCLNVGCIPSKVLLHQSLMYYEHYRDGKPDFAQMLKKKQATVKANSDGIAYLFKKNNVSYISGTATFKKDGLYINDKKHEADYIIVAVGSHPSTILNTTFDEKVVVSSTGALSLPTLPKHLITVGGGYIGLELSAVYGRLGTKVTVLEYSKQIFSEMEPEIAPVISKVLKAQNVDIKTGVAVTSIKKVGNGVEVIADKKEYKGDVALLSVGRTPATKALNLEAIGVTTDSRGYIDVDNKFHTSVQGIYAIGDCINGSMLAHKAYQDAKILVRYLSQGVLAEPTLVPAVVYTHPEIACVGETEKSAVAEHGKENVGTRIGHFSANPRARIMGEDIGFVKVIFAKKSNRVLGATIVGPEAGNMIHEFCVLMAFGGSMEDMAMICHAHPTLNEILVDTCDSQPVH